MEKTIATLSDFLDTLAKWVRVMVKAGLQYDKFLLPMNNRKARKNLVEYWNAGCPEMKPDGSVQVVAEAPQILHLISKPGEIILEPTDGIRTIAQAKDIFTGYLDSNFENWGTDQKSDSTSEMPVSVYEMKKNANFPQMFNSLSSNLDKLCLTQSQIIQFVVNRRNWLRKDGYGTFFLFKSNGHFFVANVCISSSGKLDVFINHFELDSVWLADYQHRVVVQQLQ